ncbi:hypothetical protein V492_06197 [Pseudogymnoascus sp. VKM F-4246]|nr:hypothetical protein V492_06197 [Pseudogymnoascus sp. VKM F-4246]
MPRHHEAVGRRITSTSILAIPDSEIPRQAFQLLHASSRPRISAHHTTTTRIRTSSSSHPPALATPTRKHRIITTPRPTKAAIPRNDQPKRRQLRVGSGLAPAPPRLPCILLCRDPAHSSVFPNQAAVGDWKESANCTAPVMLRHPSLASIQ